jgi:hypothetical protein
VHIHGHAHAQVILGGGKIPKDLSWGGAKKLMANVDQFLNTLVNFDKDNTPVAACEWVEKNLFVKESFNPTTMKSKSSAAAGMCAWVVNIIKYYRIYEVVEPKRVLLAQANVKLEAANAQVCACIHKHVVLYCTQDRLLTHMCILAPVHTRDGSLSCNGNVGLNRSTGCAK